MILEYLIEAKKEKEEKVVLRDSSPDFESEVATVVLTGGEISSEVSRIVQKTYFKYKNKFGDSVDNGCAKIVGKYKLQGEGKILLKVELPEGSLGTFISTVSKELKKIKYSIKKG